MEKSFFITKNKYKKTETSPDYKISLMREDKSFVEIGGAWLKENKNGEKFFSCKLNSAYVDHTKKVARKGFCLMEEPQTEVAESYNSQPKAQNDDIEGF